MQSRTISNKSVLSIAGFDPCAGAGILADIQTFMNHGVSGMAVNTCITSQDEDQVFGIEWMTLSQIEFQLKPILTRYDIELIKIGLIESLERLSEVVDLIKKYSKKDSKIIWDPIIRSSSGFEVLIKNSDLLRSIERNLFLITPNLEEYNWFISQLGQKAKTNVLIKGGHRHGTNTSDKLIIGEDEIVINGRRIIERDKHGTGCILSSSILSHLALGKTLTQSCIEAKKYIEAYLITSNTKLGKHYTIST